MQNGSDGSPDQCLYDEAMIIRSHNPDLQTYDTIVVIAAPGLRQDNLRAILSTLPGFPRILCADSVAEAESLPGLQEATLVIIDHTLQSEQVQKAVRTIRRLHAQAWILLLAAHPRDVFSFEDCRPDTVLGDGFSHTDLIEEMQKARAFQAVHDFMNEVESHN